MLNKCLWAVLLGADGSDGEGRGQERREGAAELRGLNRFEGTGTLLWVNCSRQASPPLAQPEFPYCPSRELKQFQH